MSEYAKLVAQHARMKRLTGFGIAACLLVSLVLAFTACVSANAATTEQKPALKVEWYQVDSARVIASWSRSCDAKGCADQYQVRWSALNASRATTKPATVDTFFVKRPAFGDSLMVSVSVNPVRRGVVGAVRTSSAWLRSPDSPPPPVDSLTVDTLALAEAAERDSFPVVALRTSQGLATMSTTDSVPTYVCRLARNRYTGDVVIFVTADASMADEALVGQVCESARLAYAREGSG